MDERPRFGPVLENPFNPSMDVILVVFHDGILIIYNGFIIIMIIIMNIMITMY